MHKILYVQHFSGLGGSPLSLLYLIEQLDRARWSPEVLFLGGEGPAVEMFRAHGIPVHICSDIGIYPHALGGWLPFRSLRPWRALTWAFNLLPSACKMQTFLQKHPVDLVHINTSVQLPTGLGAKWAGVPVIWHIREALHPGYTGFRRWVVRTWIDACADAIIAISKFEADALKPSPKIQVVYNFVNFEKFDRTLDVRRFREELHLVRQIPLDIPLVGMLGGVVHTKGTDTFVAAAAQVLHEHPDVHFLIAGSPPRGESPIPWKRGLRWVVEKVAGLPNIERRVHDLIRSEKLEERVHFIGMRSDVPDVLAALNVLVWPSSVSHFARPIIEAGAMARPVVASDFPSSRELVRHGATGLLFQPRNVAEMARNISYLLAHPQVAQAMGEEAYILAKRFYNAKDNTAAVFAIYDQVLGNRTKSM